MKTKDTVSDFDQPTLAYKRGKTTVYLSDSLNGGLGHFKIWYDAEEEDREYITLNNEITYLDTLIQI